MDASRKHAHWLLGAVIATALVATSALWAEAARVPDRQVNGIEWFYVFGRQGNRYFGAAEGQAKQVFYAEVPKDLGGSVTIRVLDADIQGQHDEMDGRFNTSTKFSVFGGSDLLVSHTVTPSAPDGTMLELGPLLLTQGETQGDRVIFRIEAEGLDGNDNNLFAFEVAPSQVQLFTFNPAIRLMSHEGDRMRFFPQVPSGVTGLRVWNYDLDPTGGASVLLTPPAPIGSARGIQRAFWIENSSSASWAQTDVAIPQEWTGGGQWIYQITKKTQTAANMSMRLEDQNNKPLRVYFTQGEPIQVAQAPAIKACNTFEFDASKSFDPDNQKLTYLWDLGDGTTSDQVRTQHTYQQAGDYKVLLTVTDANTGECRSSMTEQWIHANTLPVAMLEAPGTACAGSTVRLSAAKSTDTAGDQLQYAWDLGDGTMAEGAEVTHTYARGGTYPVKLLVNDGQGTACSRAQATTAIRVNASPMAKANDAIVICARSAEPQAVTFSAAGSQDPDNNNLTYRWEFGDGATAEGVKVNHTYAQGGQYAAKLTVDDGSGTNCALAIANVPVTINHAPLAQVKQQEVSTCGNEALTFDASASSDPDGNALTYRWDFGDGETGTGAKVSHRYAQGGTYRVGVTVDDGSGMACALSSANVVARANTTPRAVIKADARGCADRSLSFDATDSSDPEGQRLTYRWDFGDGTTAEGAKAQHAYATGGTYPITLTVDDEQGTACSLAVAKGETHINTAPLANAGLNSVCCLNAVTAFDASQSSDADGDQLTYRWDFGDGSTAEGAKGQHVYKKIGTYQVRVIASDNSDTACGISSAGFVAQVEEKPTANMAISSEGRDIPPTAGELLADVKRNR